MPMPPLTLPDFNLAYLIPQISKDHPELSEERIVECVEKYRNYLALCRAYPETPLMPSVDVDIAWHQHILNTRKYRDDCEAYFGRFLHHNPKMPSVEVALRSRQLYADHFGPDGDGLVMCGCSDGCDQSFDPPEVQAQAYSN